MFVRKSLSFLAQVIAILGAIAPRSAKRVEKPEHCQSWSLLVCICIGATSFGNPVQAGVITFDPPKSVDTTPFSINAAGTITGFYSVTENGAPHGFIRAPDGTITTFDVANAKCGTYPQSINRLGTIAGGFDDRNCIGHGFIRAADGTITTFDVSGATDTGPSSINDGGTVTGSYNLCSNGCEELHGFVRFDDGTYITFDPNGSVETVALSINNDGAVAGTYEDSNRVWHGFVRETDGTIKTFDPHDSTGTYPNGINRSGAIAGSYSTPPPAAGFGFLRAAGGKITMIDPLGTTDVAVYALNNKDEVTGYYQNNGYHGFAQTRDGEVKTFDPKHSVDTSPLTINSKGVIAGWYATENPGPIHGFLRTP